MEDNELLIDNQESPQEKIVSLKEGDSLYTVYSYYSIKSIPTPNIIGIYNNISDAINLQKSVSGTDWIIGMNENTITNYNGTIITYIKEYRYGEN